MSPKITIYSTTTCQPCRIVSKRLDAAGLAHEKIDLDLEGQEERLASLKARLGVSTLHTPTVEVDGEVIMQGLDANALRDLIASRS
ncbi:NrdH-like glutaredoxin [Arthrobacter phage BaileyBlu]|uniref:NrdH-like glutaredoxin n=1 Tax=Arthrobacter phage BaileyBlu TaxID=2910754 RepID=A0AA49BPS4_9CAUD|nr:thioredoxin domain [Arthrobacter phage BaileyBlu]UJQ87172.1 NrdH-like glutaredoxin [Arthrobacter phage BaileyBlu]